MVKEVNKVIRMIAETNSRLMEILCLFSSVNYLSTLTRCRHIFTSIGELEHMTPESSLKNSLCPAVYNAKLPESSRKRWIFLKVFFLSVAFVISLLQGRQYNFIIMLRNTMQLAFISCLCMLV